MTNYTIASPLLNKNKETKIVCDFNKDEFYTQYEEIFEGEQYKNGRERLKFSEDAICLDIGGNIGLSVLYFKDHAKKIYVIEPNFDYFKFLTINTKDYNNIERFNIGLGHENGGGVLISNPRETRKESIWGTGDSRQSFPMVTIDRFFEEQEIDHIDVLKIDCEGSEYPIFMSEGFGKVADKIDYIIGEGHFSSNLRPEYLPDILKEHGFKVNFLPFRNMYNDYCMMNEKGEKITKVYRTYSSTIFEAYR